MKEMLVGAVGIEPTTFGLKGRCSTTELRPWLLEHLTLKEFGAHIARRVNRDEKCGPRSFLSLLVGQHCFCKRLKGVDLLRGITRIAEHAPASRRRWRCVR
jgi:hypothetical protein